MTVFHCHLSDCLFSTMPLSAHSPTCNSLAHCRHDHSIINLHCPLLPQVFGSTETIWCIMYQTLCCSLWGSHSILLIRNQWSHPQPSQYEICIYIHYVYVYVTKLPVNPALIRIGCILDPCLPLLNYKCLHWWWLHIDSHSHVNTLPWVCHTDEFQ